MKNLKWTLCLITILCFPLFNSDSQGAGATTGGSPLAAGLIDPSRSIDWSQAGVTGGIPSSSWPACTTAQAGTTVPIPAYTGTAATINNAIIACGAANPNGSYLQLAAGTFNLSTGISWYTTWDDLSTNPVRNVALRGMGGNQTYLLFTGDDFCNGLTGLVCMAGSNSFTNGEQNVCDWTSGYSAGSTNISLSNCGSTTPAAGSLSNLHIGSLIILDQVDLVKDPGTIWPCLNGAPAGPANEVCAQEGTGAFARNDGPSVNGTAYRSQQQITRVTNCTNTNGVCTSGANITIAPGLYFPNWTGGQLPQAWYATFYASNDGVENLSIDWSPEGGDTTSSHNITIQNCYQCWVKGVRSLYAQRSHVVLYETLNSSVVDSYFYQNVAHATQSYGLERMSAAETLVQNNIFQQVTDSSPTNNGGSQGNVAAYNFGIDVQFSANLWFIANYFDHASGDGFNLEEGNIGNGVTADNIHGTHHFNTYFRGFFPGWQLTCDDGTSVCSSQTVAINLYSGSRYFNLIGNVLGTPGYHTQYQCEALATGVPCSNGNVSVYAMGHTANVGSSANTSINGYCTTPSCTATSDYDPQTVNSLMRWGNWDVVNKAAQWNPSEVPSTIGAYANAVPSTQTLPPSLYLSAKPAWWGSMPWPAIGPDVTGGNVGNCNGGTYSMVPAMASSQCTGGTLSASSLGGHVYANPAMACAFNTMGMPTDGSGNALTFNAASCYPGDFGASSVAYGDVNGDSQVTIFDALMTAQYAVGLITLTPTQQQAAEVSSTSETSPSIFDALLIAQYAVGLITKFPVQ